MTEIKEEATTSRNGEPVNSESPDQNNSGAPTNISESQTREALNAICQTIRNLSTDASVKSIRGKGIVYYYAAVRHAFDSDTPLRPFLEIYGVRSSTQIDKNLKCIWGITESIIRGTDPRVRVINMNPDNFQVCWEE